MDCFPFSKVIMWIIPFTCAVTLWRMLCHSSGFLWTQFDIKWLMCDNKNRRTNTVIATHTMNNPRNVQSTLFRTKNYWGSVVVSHQIDNVGHCPVPVRVSGEGGGWPRGGEIFSHQQIRVWPLQSGNRSHYSLYLQLFCLGQCSLNAWIKSSSQDFFALSNLFFAPTHLAFLTCLDIK